MWSAHSYYMVEVMLVRYVNINARCRASGVLVPLACAVGHRTTAHWMASGKAWGLASSLWEALLAWGAGGGPVEATAPTASTATY